MTTKRGKVLRAFRDNGTGRAFAKDAEDNFDTGTFENYRIAGLVKLAPRKKRRGQSPQA